MQTPIGRRAFFQVAGVAAGWGAAGLMPRPPDASATAVASPTALVRGVPSHVVPAESGWKVVDRPINRTPAMTRAWFRSRVRSGERTLYVSESGSDANSGSQTSPVRQINRAVQLARPGDLILVDSGTYGYTEVRGFAGSPMRWLGIMTRNDTVKATIHVPPPTDNFVNVIGSSYVGLYGFEVRGTQRDSNTNGSGISVYGNSHHVLIWQNLVHDFPGGGINCFDWAGSHDLIDIAFNTIHSTSKYSPNNTSGISIYASRDLTNTAPFSDGFGYHIIGNYIFDVECLVPFTPGGFDFVTDGNGISLDCISSAYGYRKPVLVADNIITGCGGRGVLAFRTQNVMMTRNTAVGNLRTVSPAISGGTELEGKTDRTVQIVNNLMYPLHTPATTDSTSSFIGNVFLGSGVTPAAANTDYPRSGFDYFTGPLSAGTLRVNNPRARFVPRSG